MNQRQSKQLIQEKAELQAQLHDKDQDLGRYKDRVARQDSQDANLTPVSPSKCSLFPLLFQNLHMSEVGQYLEKDQDLHCLLFMPSTTIGIV